MSRGIFIVGTDSSLTAAVGGEAGKRVERYAAALIPNRFASPVPDRLEGQGTSAPPQFPARKPPGEEGGQVIPLDWNAGSPISARALVLAAENRLEHIDLAILVCSPPSLRRPPEQLAPSEIEIAVNDHIKGWFFLVRELVSAFLNRRDGNPSGTLAMVLADPGGATEKGEYPDMAAPPVAAAFRALAQGVLASRTGKPWQAFGFSSELGEDRDFASFIFRTIDEGGKRGEGKWHKYGRFPLFGR